MIASILITLLASVTIGTICSFHQHPLIFQTIIKCRNVNSARYGVVGEIDAIFRNISKDPVVLATIKTFSESQFNVPNITQGRFYIYQLIIIIFIISTFFLNLEMFKSARYDIKGSDILVAQSFPYIPRVNETYETVKLMRNRQELRKRYTRANDKKYNRLITLPGTSGKTYIHTSTYAYICSTYSSSHAYV